MTSKLNTASNVVTKKARKPLLQPIIGISIFALYAIIITIIGQYVSDMPQKVAMNAILGLFMGYVLQRSFFGFAGTAARTSKGNPKLAYAVLALFAVVAIAVAALAGAGNTTFINAITHHARALGIATILGATIFGIGMILAKACASGSLTDMSTGSLRVAVILVFFVIGAGPGQMLQPIFYGGKYWSDHSNGIAVWQKGTDIHSLAAYLSGGVHVGDASSDTLTSTGLLLTVLISLVGFVGLGLIAYIIAKKVREVKKISDADFKEIERMMDELPDVYSDWALKSGLSKKQSNSKFWKIYFKVFAQKISLWFGAVAFGALMIVSISMNGKGWGVTTSFAKMFDWIFGVTGKASGLVNNKGNFGPGTILGDSGTWRNLGLLIGAVSYILMANKFKFTLDTKRDWKSITKTYSIAAIAGFFLGFGARLAEGCNAGQFATGLTTFSLSGWVFGIFMLAGAALALWLVSLIQKRKTRN